MTFEGTRLRRIGKDSLPFAVLFIFLTLMVWPTAEGIVNRWFKFDEAYSHGLLLLLVSFFLVARAARLNPVVPGFYPRWLVPFALALVAYVLGDVMRLQALSELTMIPLILGGAAILLGWQQIRYFIVPIGILFFAIPVWDFTSWTLQIITVEMCRLLLGLFDIDFKVEGVFVYLTGVGAFEVANGCSGLRYLLVGQSLALLYGELNLRRISSKVWIYLTAICLALVANWIRVFVIIYVGHESNMQSSLIYEHDDFGWWVFAGTLVPLFVIGRLLERRDSGARDLNNSHADSRIGEIAGADAGRPLAAVSAAMALVALTWLALPPAPASGQAGVAKHDASLVSENRWLPLFERGILGWRPEIERPDRILESSYIYREGLSDSGDSSDTLFLGLYSYDSQRAGHEVVHYNNRIHSSSHLVERVFNIESLEGLPMSGMTLRHRGTDQMIHVAFGYYVEGRWENNELTAKLAQLPGILNSRTDASLLVIGLQCGECDAEERLSEIVPAIHSKTESYLDQLYKTED